MRYALTGLLPILPHKAAEGLSQLGIVIAGKTMDQLFALPMAEGLKMGDPQPLFPKLK